MSFELDYDEMALLDAESLAEAGIREAYEELLPKLREHVPQPMSVEEVFGPDNSSYTVRCGTKEYPIYGPGLKETNGGGWGRATTAFFEIVNGGNDLGGMFLTPAQAEDCRASLPNRTDWPYLPMGGDSWGGMYH